MSAVIFDFNLQVLLQFYCGGNFCHVNTRNLPKSQKADESAATMTFCGWSKIFCFTWKYLNIICTHIPFCALLLVQGILGDCHVTAWIQVSLEDMILKVI